jgi:hypothetical protein
VQPVKRGMRRAAIFWIRVPEPTKCDRENLCPPKRRKPLVDLTRGVGGRARLHCRCCDQSFARYRQTVIWDGSTLSNLTAFKRLQGRIAAMNDASWGSVPVLVA